MTAKAAILCKTESSILKKIASTKVHYTQIHWLRCKKDFRQEGQIVLDLCNLSYLFRLFSFVNLSIMWNVKNIALLLVLVFGAKTMVANSLVSTYFFGNNFKLVQPYCKQHPKNNSEHQKEFLTSSVDVLFAVAVNCQQTFLSTAIEKNGVLWNDESSHLFYVSRLHSLLYLEHPFPPPKS